MAITPHPGYKSRLYVSRATESSYGGGSTLTHYIDTPEIPIIRTQRLTRTDLDLANNVRGRTKTIPIGDTLPQYTLPMWATPDSVLFAAAFAMGNDTVDASGTNRTHAIDMTDPTFPGSFSLEQHLKGAAHDLNLDYLHNGVVMDGFDLYGGREGILMVDWILSGSGQTGNTGDQTEGSLSNMMTNGDYVFAEKTRISIQAASGEGDSIYSGALGSSWLEPSSVGVFRNSLSTVLSEAINDWRLSYRNNWTWRRAGGSSAGAGNFGSQPHAGPAPLVTLTLNLVSHSNTDSFIKSVKNLTYADNPQWGIAIEGLTDIAAGTSFRAIGFVLPLVTLQADPVGTMSLQNHHTNQLVFEGLAETTAPYRPLYGFFETTGTSVFNQ